MKTVRTAIRTLTAVSAAACAVLFSALFYLNLAAPDEYYNIRGEEFSVASILGEAVRTDYRAVTAVGAESDPSVQQEVLLTLFGCIPIKAAQVETVDEVELAPCGTPFGVKILTDGVLIVGLNEIATDRGNKNPAKEVGLCTGDLITQVDGAAVRSNEELAAIIKKSGGKPVTICYRRGEKENTVRLTPALSAVDRCYKAGVWVRDSSAGIGTVSFYDPSTRAFGGLGHAICDVDTGDILPVLQGDVVDVTIHGVVKGTVGTPGELRGSFASQAAVGTIYLNNEAGVFGELFDAPDHRAVLPMGLKQEIHTGKATVWTTVDGEEPKAYELEIERINLLENSPTKNMVIRITDPALLEKTGGIVQGMSGSPIVQDGKLIGAVTHVFVNDPSRGYAIFAENMYENVALMRSLSKAG